jgi:hypothetical protein
MLHTHAAPTPAQPSRQTRTRVVNRAYAVEEEYEEEYEEQPEWVLHVPSHAMPAACASCLNTARQLLPVWVRLLHVPTQCLAMMCFIMRPVLFLVQLRGLLEPSVWHPGHHPLLMGRGRPAPRMAAPPLQVHAGQILLQAPLACSTAHQGCVRAATWRHSVNLQLERGWLGP